MRREATLLFFFGAMRVTPPNGRTSMAMSGQKVADLQAFLKSRGVVVSGQRKLELSESCAIARDIDLEFDPDGLVEDRAEIIAHKVTDGGDGADIVLSNLAFFNGNRDLSSLPFLKK